MVSQYIGRYNAGLMKHERGVEPYGVYDLDGGLSIEGVGREGGAKQWQ